MSERIHLSVAEGRALGEAAMRGATVWIPWAVQFGDIVLICCCRDKSEVAIVSLSRKVRA